MLVPDLPRRNGDSCARAQDPEGTIKTLGEEETETYLSIPTGAGPPIPARSGKRKAPSRTARGRTVPEDTTGMREDRPPTYEE